MLSLCSPHYHRYDLDADPYQLDNLYYTRANTSIKEQLAQQLLEQWHCAGPSCV